MQKDTLKDTCYALAAALLIVIAALCVSSCASTQRAGTRFVAPSTAPIAKAQAAIAQKQIETKQHIEKAQEIVKTLTITLPADKLKVDALTAVLGQALDSNDQLRTENDSLKGANDQLTTQVGQQTVQANQLADAYDKCGADKTLLQLSRHKYVKLTWLFGGILGAEILAAGAFVALKFGLLSV